MPSDARGPNSLRSEVTTSALSSFAKTMQKQSAKEIRPRAFNAPALCQNLIPRSRRSITPSAFKSEIADFA